LFYLALITSALIVTTQAAVAQRTANQPAPSESTVLVIRAARDGLHRAEEELFVEELRLALDKFRVLPVDVDPERFAGFRFPEQLAYVRKLNDKNRGLAAVWLDWGPKTMVFVHVVVFNAGRVLVRIVEGNPRRSGFATDLAMATRELLGTAYLFENTPVDPHVERIVDNVRGRLADATRKNRWTLLATARTGAGLLWFEGPSFTAGGQVGLEWGSRHGWAPRVLLGGSRGFLDGTLSRNLKGIALEAGAGIAYHLDFDPIRLGLALDLQSLWSRLDVSATPTSAHTASLWNLRADIGPEVRLRMSSEVELLLQVNAGFYGRRRRFTLLSNGERIFDAPFATWAIAAGVAISL